MATANVHYEGQLRTQCTHIQSGTTITTDAPTDNHGKGEAFSPTDLLATSLVSCMLTTMGIAAKKHNIPFEKADAALQKVMASDPRRVSAVIVTVNMAGSPGLSDEQRTMLEEVALNCPVAKSLHPDIEQQIKFEYH